MSSLHVSEELSLPARAVTETFALLSVRGAGKTNAARVMAEEMFAAKAPFVAIDPVGSWFGLRSGRDGKRGGGIPIPIFGGKHGDVPLERSGGNLVADLVVDQRLSCVLDLSAFESEAAKKAFLLDFARRLYSRNTEPLHLFLEEADDYVPQKPMHDELQLVRAWENIVRRGRSRGLGMTLITQRSAVIAKNVLTQVGTLITLRTTSPQDRAAVEAWVEHNGQKREILESLAGLESGEAWVWSPEFLKKTVKIKFRLSRTFDSGATPKLGASGKAAATLADVDLGALTKRMAETIERAKADDPRALRAEIATLKKRLAVVPSDPAPKAVEIPVLKEGQVKRCEQLAKRLENMADRLTTESTEMRREAVDLRKVISSAWPPVNGFPRPFVPLPVDPGQRREIKPRSGPRSGIVKLQRSVSVDGTTLGKCEQKILGVLAAYPEGCEAGKLALLSGYRFSGGFRNSLSTLRTAGLMEGDNGGMMRLTSEGYEAAGGRQEPPHGAALIDYWRTHPSLGKCERAVFEVLLGHPKGMSGEDVAAAAGYEFSGGFRNSLSTLRTAGLLTGRGNAWIQLTEELL